MKKAVKILSLALVLLMLVVGMASCGKKISGTYVSEKGAKYIFDGNNVSYVSGSVEHSGTYEIKKVDNDYRIYIVFDTQKVDGKATEIKNPTVLGGDGGLELRNCEYMDPACQHAEGAHYIIIHETRYALQGS